MNIIITMAGAGRRLVSDSTLIKPLFPIQGKPMIEHVIKNLGLGGRYIYIVQKAHRQEWKLDDLLNRLTPNCVIVEVDGLTEGQASSALLAREYINDDTPLLTANCDQILNWDSSDFQGAINNKDIDGCIPVIESKNPSMSFAEVDSYGNVIRTAEKEVISNWGTVGLYYWKRGRDFVECADEMIAENNRVNNEFYICPVYNYAIKKDKTISIYEVQSMHALGTKQEINDYLFTL